MDKSQNNAQQEFNTNTTHNNQHRETTMITIMNDDEIKGSDTITPTIDHQEAYTYMSFNPNNSGQYDTTFAEAIPKMTNVQIITLTFMLIVLVTLVLLILGIVVHYALEEQEQRNVEIFPVTSL